MHPQDDFDDLLDNMDAEFQAAPAARVGQPITASQQQAMDMDEFERQLAMGELDDDGPGGGAAVAAADGPVDEAAEPALTASQQAAAEMDEFERQLAFGDDPTPAAGSGGTAAALDGRAEGAATQAAVPVMTASQQVAAEMDDFEWRLALDDDPPAAEDRQEAADGQQAVAPSSTASQQAAAEMDEFERRLALGDDLPPEVAGPAPAMASRRADDGSHRQPTASDETPTADEGSSAVATPQQAPVEAPEAEQQLASTDIQHDRERGPSVPVTDSQQPAANADAVQRQLSTGETAPQTAVPTASASAASTEKLVLHATKGDLAINEGGSPAAKRARTSVEGSAQSARHQTDRAGPPVTAKDPVQRGGQHASHTDAGSTAHDEAAATEDDQVDEDDDMDLADMDDDELLRLVMTQAEEEAGRE